MQMTKTIYCSEIKSRIGKICKPSNSGLFENIPPHPFKATPPKHLNVLPNYCQVVPFGPNDNQSLRWVRTTLVVFSPAIYIGFYYILQSNL